MNPGKIYRVLANICPPPTTAVILVGANISRAGTMLRHDVRYVIDRMVDRGENEETMEKRASRRFLFIFIGKRVERGGALEDA